MQADDLVSRLALGPAHAGVLYGLTPYGHTLGPVFDALWKWGSTHLARADARRGTIVQPPRSPQFAAIGTAQRSERSGSQR
jgi:DNA-binding HxlR family transcriptional regulator